jgi:hypothetical protein
MTKKIRTYSELTQFETFEDRYAYLRLGGGVGASTFGFDRYINQAFYTSTEWRRARRIVIARDSGCDLGVLGMHIHANLLVHHMNPVEIDDLLDHEEWVLDPEYLITTSQNTHNAIHYGGASILPQKAVARAPGDTKLW